uniref:glycerol-3-phosphate 1-O-acyltransferase n=1 Tax=Lactuca sativa TaxID=4236 RepID=A0A9R1X3Y4_LACSA|nr:hypothetical protein LSAT_V11C700351890 [Lactuca sativa]
MLAAISHRLPVKPPPDGDHRTPPPHQKPSTFQLQTTKLLSGIQRELEAKTLPKPIAQSMEELYHNYKNAVLKSGDPCVEDIVVSNMCVAFDHMFLDVKLLALLSDIGLNIREAHVFSTTDGYSLDVFLVNGRPLQETKALHVAMERAISRSEGSKRSKSTIKRAVATEANFIDTKIDIRLLKIGEKVASRSCGDLHHGVYVGQEVDVKILRSEHLNEALAHE